MIEMIRYIALSAFDPRSQRGIALGLRPLKETYMWSVHAKWHAQGPRMWTLTFTFCWQLYLLGDFLPSNQVSLGLDAEVAFAAAG